MFVLVVFASCLLHSLSSGQVIPSVQYPSIGPIYKVPNNNSVLNFTFNYPTQYQFDYLYVRFTVYDFNSNNITNPAVYAFQWVNFTDSNFSLPWVVPPVILQSGDYVIACFEWLQTDFNNQTVSDTYKCVIARVPTNNVVLPMASPTASAVVYTNTAVTISAYFPSALPYDHITITSAINGTILPSPSNSTSNETYSSMNTFMYMNLTPSTRYNICVYFDYANMLINGSESTSSQCQIIMTLGGGGGGGGTGGTSAAVTSTAVTGTAVTSIAVTGTAVAGTAVTGTGGNSTSVINTTNSRSNMILSNTLIMTLLFIFVLY